MTDEITITPIVQHQCEICCNSDKALIFNGPCNSDVYLPTTPNLCTHQFCTGCWERIKSTNPRENWRCPVCRFYVTEWMERHVAPITQKTTITLEFDECSIDPLFQQSMANFYSEQSDRFLLMKGDSPTVFDDESSMMFCNNYLEAFILYTYWHQHGLCALLSDESLGGWIVLSSAKRCFSA